MVTAKKTIPHELVTIAQELRAMADQHYFDPMKYQPPHQRHCRQFCMDQQRLKVQFTRTDMGNLKIHHLSIGSWSGIENVPENVIQTIRSAFFPSGESVEFPSVMGNSRQFIEEIK